VGVCKGRVGRVGISALCPARSWETNRLFQSSLRSLPPVLVLGFVVFSIFV
jgi:hypothetical protein